MPVNTDTLDTDAVLAVVELVGRSGGRSFEVGYLDDEPPHRWHCSAFYKGARVSGEHPDRPDLAADLLARKILDGGTCTHCGRPITVGPEFVDDVCRWTRDGKTWTRGCA